MSSGAFSFQIWENLRTTLVGRLRSTGQLLTATVMYEMHVLPQDQSVCLLLKVVDADKAYGNMMHDSHRLVYDFELTGSISRFTSTRSIWVGLFSWTFKDPLILGGLGLRIATVGHLNPNP